MEHEAVAAYAKNMEMDPAEVYANYNMTPMDERPIAGGVSTVISESHDDMGKGSSIETVIKQIAETGARVGAEAINEVKQAESLTSEDQKREQINEKRAERARNELNVPSTGKEAVKQAGASVDVELDA